MKLTNAFSHRMFFKNSLKNNVHKYVYFITIRSKQSGTSFSINLCLLLVIMKGTKVQTFGARAVAGAWCMAGRLIAI